MHFVKAILKEMAKFHWFFFIRLIIILLNYTILALLVSWSIINILVSVFIWFTFTVIDFCLRVVFKFNPKLVKFCQQIFQDPKSLVSYYSSVNQLWVRNLKEKEKTQYNIYLPNLLSQIFFCILWELYLDVDIGSMSSIYFPSMSWWQGYY